MSTYHAPPVYPGRRAGRPGTRESPETSDAVSEAVGELLGSHADRLRCREVLHCTSVVMIYDLADETGGVVGSFAVKCSHHYPEADEGQIEARTMRQFNVMFGDATVRCPHVVGYVERAHLLVTVAEPGRPLRNWLGRPFRTDGRRTAMRLTELAATWLRRFQAMEPHGAELGIPQTLRRVAADAIERLVSVAAGTAGRFLVNPEHVDAARRLLRITEGRFEHVATARVRRHADFSPANMLVHPDDMGITVLDVTRDDRSLPCEDIAFFLETLDATVTLSPQLAPIRSRLRSRFLECCGAYNDPAERVLLRYCELTAVLRILANRATSFDSRCHASAWARALLSRQFLAPRLSECLLALATALDGLR